MDVCQAGAVPATVPSLRRLALLLVGCVVLGIGVALLLGADLGSDGYSTLVNGVSLASDIEFWVANLAIGVAFVMMAALRNVVPGIGTDRNSMRGGTSARGMVRDGRRTQEGR